jgi:hypothetical protein
VSNLAFASDDVVWLSWKQSTEYRVNNLLYTKEVIVAYVTAGAKIHLYAFLERLRGYAIYCDTDWGIFNKPNTEPWPIATGDTLGDIQSELKHSEHIVVFVSEGQTIMHIL